jgi:hypothetical protein
MNILLSRLASGSAPRFEMTELSLIGDILLVGQRLR